MKGKLKLREGLTNRNGDHKRLYRKHFFLSRIALIYSFMGPTEIESNNTMKDEIIFIRNDIILVVFIINNEF